MKKVTMYECEHCGQYFKTPDRHKCKKDPKKRNCFSCKWHKQEWTQYETIDYVDVGVGMIPTQQAPYPICYKISEIEMEGHCDLDILKDCNYNLQCQYYEYGDWYDTEEFKKTINLF